MTSIACVCVCVCVCVCECVFVCVCVCVVLWQTNYSFQHVINLNIFYLVDPSADFVKNGILKPNVHNVEAVAIHTNTCLHPTFVFNLNGYNLH